MATALHPCHIPCCYHQGAQYCEFLGSSRNCMATVFLHFLNFLLNDSVFNRFLTRKLMTLSSAGLLQYSYAPHRRWEPSLALRPRERSVYKEVPVWSLWLLHCTLLPGLCGEGHCTVEERTGEWGWHVDKECCTSVNISVKQLQKERSTSSFMHMIATSGTQLDIKYSLREQLAPS